MGDVGGVGEGNLQILRQLNLMMAFILYLGMWILCVNLALETIMNLRSVSNILIWTQKSHVGLDPDFQDRHRKKQVAANHFYTI